MYDYKEHTQASREIQWNNYDLKRVKTQIHVSDTAQQLVTDKEPSTTELQSSK